MTATERNYANLAIADKGERRSETRVNLKFAIEVCGFERHGHFFNERATTSDVSESGGNFRLSADVEKDSVLAIRLIERRNGRETETRPVLFQVSRIHPDYEGWTVGVSRLQPILLWRAEFPERDHPMKLV
jgi:hypothetical protein